MKKIINKHGNDLSELKVGDIVYCTVYGKGIVEKIDLKKDITYHITVRFRDVPVNGDSDLDDAIVNYTIKGYIFNSAKYQSLFLTEPTVSVPALDIEVEIKDHQFKPFDRVLVRTGKYNAWKPQWFGSYDNTKEAYITVNGTGYSECIPYEGNEHLLGTSNNYNYNENNN